MQHLIGDASEGPALKAGAPVGSQGNQIYPVTFSIAGNGFRGVVRRDHHLEQTAGWAVFLSHPAQVIISVAKLSINEFLAKPLFFVIKLLQFLRRQGVDDPKQSHFAVKSRGCR